MGIGKVMAYDSGYMRGFNDGLKKEFNLEKIKEAGFYGNDDFCVEGEQDG